MRSAGATKRTCATRASPALRSVRARSADSIVKRCRELLSLVPTRRSSSTHSCAWRGSFIYRNAMCAPSRTVSTYSRGPSIARSSAVERCAGTPCAFHVVSTSAMYLGTIAYASAYASAAKSMCTNRRWIVCERKVMPASPYRSVTTSSASIALLTPLCERQLSTSCSARVSGWALDSFARGKPGSCCRSLTTVDFTVENGCAVVGAGWGRRVAVVRAETGFGACSAAREDSFVCVRRARRARITLR